MKQRIYVQTLSHWMQQSFNKKSLSLSKWC